MQQLLDQQRILIRRPRDVDQPAGHDFLPRIPRRIEVRVSVLAAKTAATQSQSTVRMAEASPNLSLKFSSSQDIALAKVPDGRAAGSIRSSRVRQRSTHPRPYRKPKTGTPPRAMRPRVSVRGSVRSSYRRYCETSGKVANGHCQSAEISTGRKN